MRLAIHELGAAHRAIAHDEVSPAMKMLARVSRILGSHRYPQPLARSPAIF
jgi:tryptophan 2,3-dioxygenase